MAERRPGTYKELADQWIQDRPELKMWLDTHKDEFCDVLGLWTEGDELMVILMRLADPDHWPDANTWSGWKDDLGRARDKVLGPFMDGKPVDEVELRIAVRMLVSNFNHACERIYYMQRNLGRPRRY